MKSRQEIKAIAKDAMKAQQGVAIFLILVLIAIVFVIGIVDIVLTFVVGAIALSWIVYLLALTILYVLIVNYCLEFIKIYTHQEASVNSMFTNLNINFLRKLGGQLWMSLWVILWTLLFVIPGIIKIFSYFLTSYILADCPNVTARNALKLSMRMTHGHKMDIFIFSLSFFGWFLLSSITLGIAFVIFVGPYYETSFAGLYVELRDKALRNGIISPEELGMDSMGEHNPMDNNQMGNFN